VGPRAGLDGCGKSPPSHAGIRSLDLLARSDCAIPIHAAYMLTF